MLNVLPAAIALSAVVVLPGVQVCRQRLGCAQHCQRACRDCAVHLHRGRHYKQVSHCVQQEAIHLTHLAVQTAGSTRMLAECMSGVCCALTTVSAVESQRNRWLLSPLSHGQIFVMQN
jgi:hypothetical protein